MVLYDDGITEAVRAAAAKEYQRINAARKEKETSRQEIAAHLEEKQRKSFLKMNEEAQCALENDIRSLTVSEVRQHALRLEPQQPPLVDESASSTGEADENAPRCPLSCCMLSDSSIRLAG